MVYFIQNTGNGCIKIGHAADPDARLRQLQGACSEKLILLNSRPGGRDDEQRLHRRFAHLRQEGEWFLCTEELLEVATGRRESLSGMFFLSFKGPKLVWQGCVISEVRAGYYLVQIYSWLFGEPTCKRIVSIEDMRSFELFDEVEDLREKADRLNGNTGMFDDAGPASSR